MLKIMIIQQNHIFRTDHRKHCRQITGIIIRADARASLTKLIHHYIGGQYFVEHRRV